MTIAPLGLHDLLRTGDVKRWHTINTTREQTLAEHQHNVTIIALSLYNDLIGVNVDVDSKAEVCMLMMLAMFHDAPEVITGDIPSPAKELLSMGDGMSELDGVELQLFNSVPFFGVEWYTPSFHSDLVKMADLIESSVWICEHAVGNHSKQVADWLRKTMEGYVFRLELDTDFAWHAAVNKVLVAYGQPPIGGNNETV